MLKLLLIIFLTQILLCAQSEEHDYGISVSATGRVLWGEGWSNCDDKLPSLGVASENMINTKAEWDDFVKANPFFVLGATDSKCKQCCRSEPILNELNAMLERRVLTYPEKDKKKKKIVRKEIKIARIDFANKTLMSNLS